jgi:Protein of unknown function (DUF3435)
MLKIPLFRKAIRTADGCQRSETEAMHYQTYAEYVKRLGELTGFEDRLTTYCFRRGTANAIDGACLSPLLYI